MSYPLFDSGYILWAGDLDSRLKEQVGLSFRALGVDPRLLLRSYYDGCSVSAALSVIAARHGLDALAGA
ncbi:hypothetical protein [Paramagnetospirillum marisnigri]|nr:hypothetical protein [Paramagnetospirillum marisnigri]